MASLFAAPAIVHPGNLMPIKVLPFESYMLLIGFDPLGNPIERKIFEDNSRPDAFVSLDFFNRYEDAASGVRDIMTAVVTNREEEKKTGFLPPASWSGRSASTGNTPDYVMIRHEHRPTKFMTSQKDWRTVAVEPGDQLYHADKRWLDANGLWVCG
tara:strand:- start:771 stop:1238 length:468 start_codon:yes stop_codon:yes gene_type:complete